MASKDPTKKPSITIKGALKFAWKATCVAAVAAGFRLVAGDEMPDAIKRANEAGESLSLVDLAEISWDGVKLAGEKLVDGVKSLAGLIANKETQEAAMRATDNSPDLML